MNAYSEILAVASKIKLDANEDTTMNICMYIGYIDFTLLILLPYSATNTLQRWQLKQLVDNGSHRPRDDITYSTYTYIHSQLSEAYMCM